ASFRGSPRCLEPLRSRETRNKTRGAAYSLSRTLSAIERRPCRGHAERRPVRAALPQPLPARARLVPPAARQHGLGGRRDAGGFHARLSRLRPLRSGPAVRGVDLEHREALLHRRRPAARARGAPLGRRGRRRGRNRFGRRPGARRARDLRAGSRDQGRDRVAAGQAQDSARSRVLRGRELRRDRRGAWHHTQPCRRAAAARKEGIAAGDVAAVRRRTEMSCPTELEWSMYVDEAITAAERARLDDHLATCDACSRVVAALGDEAEALRCALRKEESTVPIPAFRRPDVRRGPLAAAAVLIALASSSLILVDALRALRVPEPLAWLNPFTPPNVVNLVLDALVFVAMEGRSMWISAIEIAGAAVVVALVVAAALAAARRIGSGAAVFSAALAALAFSTQSEALEIRRAEGVVSVAADETIDDTLIALGEEIEIDGTITGNLIAFGRRVVIRGAVEGQLVTGARSVEIAGRVDGSVLGGAETLILASGAIA